MKFDIPKYADSIQKFMVDKMSHLSDTAVEWFGIVMIHCATIPSVLALLLSYSDKMPSLDIILFVWGGLFLLFLRSLIRRDVLNTITIGVGFFIHAILLAMVVFK